MNQIENNKKKEKFRNAFEDNSKSFSGNAKKRTAADYTKEKSNNNQKMTSGADKIQAIATICIVFITFFYTRYASQQVREMKKAVEFNKKYVDIAAQSLNSIEDHFKLEQRAWLTIEEIKFRNELKANEPNYIDLKIINAGKTPALRVRFKYKTYFKGQPQPNAMVEEINGPGEASYGPNSEYNISLVTAPLTQTKINALQSGKEILYFNIEIIYFDIFNNETVHHTTACGFYNGSSKTQFSLCDSGNNMD